MPFVMIHGIPKGTNVELLKALRRSIVETIHQSMLDKAGKPIPVDWIRPFFIDDLLDDPLEADEGAKTLYVRLDTAMYTLEPNYTLAPKKVIGLLAQTIWEAFEGQYEVEAFIGTLHPEWKALIEACE